MKLSILIATLGRREDKLKKLLRALTTQVKWANGEVEVVIYWNNGTTPIGEIRQALIEEAKGEYVCFVDDDDMVPRYYIKEILKALGKDYVGFEVRLFNDGVQQLPVFHSHTHQSWYENDTGYYRGVTHLNPIRKSIAVQGEFKSDGAGEDASWARGVLDLVKTENYIDKIMYFYHHSSTDTSFGGWHQPNKKEYKRPELTNKFFRYHPDSKIRGRHGDN